MLAFALLSACEQEYVLSGEVEPEQIPESTLPPVAIPGPSASVARGAAFTLDGTSSFDPDMEGANLTYAWELVFSPEGASAELTGAFTSNPLFSSEDLGIYELALTVVDEDNLTSENIAIQTLEVVPWEDLEITLEWNEEVDLDVHLIAPNGAYFEHSDCFFGNPAPDWGVEGLGEDDPVLNDDDDASGGPEVIDLTAPAPGVYTVMVQLYNDRGLSPSTTPVVTVLTADQQLLEIEGPALTAEGQVWIAGTIDWPSGEILPSSEVSTHEDLGGEPYNQDTDAE